MNSNSTIVKENNYPEHDPKLNVLAQLCSQRIEDLFDKLDVDVQLSGNKYIGICPIHGDSDNTSTLNIYYDGYDVPGYWKCRTRSCQSKFGRTIIGFTRGRLSALHCGYHWKKNPKAKFGFPGTLDFLCNFLGTKLSDIKIDPKEQERRRFMAECVASNKLYTHENATIHRDRVRNNLIIPSEYFLKRGYPEDILDSFDIGMARKPKDETKNRIIVPIYNDKEYLVGYTCRSIFDRCENCKLFHDPIKTCPVQELERNLCSKWRHMGFNSQEKLYNYWRAKPHIISNKSVILVEGPGDVWRLEQHGIKNAVGMFGHTLYDAQERLLANAQCMSMIVLTDTDAAGTEGASEIKRKYGRMYRTFFPNISEHDAGDMNEDAITENIKPLIEASKRYL